MAVVKKGFVSNQQVGTTAVLTPDAAGGNVAISTGDWMVAVVIPSVNSATVAAPSGGTGWSLLGSKVFGSRVGYVFGKLREAGETAYTFTNSAAGNKTAVLMWGSGSGSLGGWKIGTFTGRPGSTGGQYTTVGLGVTTDVANALVLSLSLEATAAAEGSAPTVGTPATHWFYVGTNGSIIESIEVGTFFQVTPGLTADVTTTWPNAQTLNGAGMLLAIQPPAPANVAPTASYTSSTSFLTASFNGSASSDSDGTISSYAWTFGDSSTGTGAIVSHTYAAAGTYTVVLTVTDNDGATGTVSHTVTVTAPPPSASPTTKGFVSHQINGSSATLTPDTASGNVAIATGDWMIAAVVVSVSTTTVTPPTGWTLLESVVMGSRSAYVYGKMRESGDAGYVFNTSAAGNKTAVLMWGTNGDVLTQWKIGDLNNRSISTTTTAIAKSISTTKASTLVVALEFEASSAAETGLPGVTAPAAHWFYIGTNGAIIETVEAATFVKSTAGATGDITITTENATNNASAMLIGIPPVTGTLPTASFTATPTNLVVATNSSASTGTGITRSFDWGDGTAVSTGTSPSHTYAVDGTYVITLTVTDSSGSIATTTRTVTATAAPVPLPFTYKASSGAAEVPLTVKYKANSGAAEVDFTAITFPIGFFTIADFLKDPHAAHRGGGGNWPEGTARAYKNSVHYRMKAIELSVRKTSDGVLIVAHDADTARIVPGTSYVIASTPWATLAVLTTTAANTDDPSQPGQPMTKLKDMLDLYAANHVIIIEDKTYANTVEILNLMDTYPDHLNHFIFKSNYSAIASPAAATARGYKVWGYYFDADMANFASTQTKFDFVGLDFNSSNATITAAVALASNQRTWAHILTTRAQYDRMKSLGCTGFMISDLKAVLPKFPGGAPANIPPTAAFTSSQTNLVVSVDGSNSTKPDGAISSYSWSWGDGTTSTGITQSHTYSAGGTYNITLTVADVTGATNSLTRTVTLTSPPVTNALGVDTFGRTSTTGWGTAETGGAWVVEGGTAPILSVSGGAGLITMAPGVTRTLSMPNVLSTTAITTADVSLDSVPTGGGLYVAVLGRKTSSGSTYSAFLWIQSDGKVNLLIRQGTTILTNVLVAGITYTANMVLRIKFSAIGSGSTTLSAKVWKVGDAEPSAWISTIADNIQDAQTPGTVGVIANNSGSATSTVIVKFDNFQSTGTQVSNVPPVANFTASPTFQTVAFNGSSSTDQNGSIVSYTWNYGDGSTGTGVNTTHTYASAGSFSVVLTVTDNQGAVSNVTKTVVTTAQPAGNQPPVANFTTYADDTVVSVSAVASTDSDGYIKTFSWNFGDGTTDSGVTATKYYTSAGAKTITLTVTDDKGVAASVSKTITVTNAPVPPSGTGITAFGSLATQATMTETLAQVPTGNKVSYGSGTYSFRDFHPTTHMGVLVWTNIYGVLGSGAGTGGTKLEMAPNSSTQASTIPPDGTNFAINGLHLFRGGTAGPSGPSGPRVPVEFGGFWLHGTEQGHAYNGLMVYEDDGAKLHDVRVTGIKGTDLREPGETFSVHLYRCNGVQFDRVVVSGKDDAGSVIGASLIGGNYCSNVVFNDCQFLDSFAAGSTMYETTNVTYNRVVSRNHIVSFNFENVLGTININQCTMVGIGDTGHLWSHIVLDNNKGSAILNINDPVWDGPKLLVRVHRIGYQGLPQKQDATNNSINLYIKGVKRNDLMSIIT